MSEFEDSIPVAKKKTLKESPAEINMKELPGTDIDAPEKKYEKPKSRWTQDELLEVFDKLMFEGQYRETYRIKNKLSVTFRSRSAEETMQISREIDNTPFNLISTVQEHKAMLNLSYSLVNYSGKDFSNVEQKEIYKFLSKLPIFVISALVDKLSEFDSKVEEACREAEENF